MTENTHYAPQLDDMLTAEEAAAWLKLSKRVLAQKSAGMKPAVPVFRLGERGGRYHPRTILAKLAKDAGVPMETIAASYGMHVTVPPGRQ